MTIYWKLNKKFPINLISNIPEKLKNENFSTFLSIRITRNKIAYDGFFVDKSYIERKIKDILEIIRKLKGIIEKKIMGEE